MLPSHGLVFQTDSIVDENRDRRPELLEKSQH